MAGANPSHGITVSLLLGDRVGPALQKKTFLVISEDKEFFPRKERQVPGGNIANAKQNLAVKKEKQPVKF